MKIIVYSVCFKNAVYRKHNAEKKLFQKANPQPRSQGLFSPSLGARETLGTR